MKSEVGSEREGALLEMVARLEGKVLEMDEQLLRQRENFQAEIRGLQELLVEREGPHLDSLPDPHPDLLPGGEGTGNWPLTTGHLSLERVQGLIREECDGVREMLIGKNLAYGNSAIEPLRCFSKGGPMEQLDVRIDDKLSRVMRGSAAGEDVELDLVGYLILKRVARRVNHGDPGR